jgi:hypothetical protein
METKNIPALLAALFFILSLLLYFDVVPTRDQSAISETLDAPAANTEINGVLVSNDCAVESHNNYREALGNKTFIADSGFFISSKLIYEMLMKNKNGFPKGIYVTYGAKKDQNGTYLPEIILSLPERAETDFPTEVKDSISNTNDPNVYALISYRTSFCPTRCFNPIYKK